MYRRERKIPDNCHEVASLLGPFRVIWFISCFFCVAFIESYSRRINSNNIHTCTNPRTTVKCCLYNRANLANHTDMKVCSVDCVF